MTKNFAAVWFLVTLSVSSAGAAVPDRVALDVKLCHPAPSTLLQHLPPGLRDGGRYIHLCPVLGEQQKIVLYILTPRLDLAGKDFPFVENLMKNHKGISRSSIIFDINMKTLGEFLGTFPFDPPGMLEVTFTDWHGGFPFRIDFDAPATGMHRAEHFDPLYWNAQIRKFQDSPP